MATAKLVILLILLTCVIVAMVISGIATARDARKEREMSVRTCDVCLKRQWECECFNTSKEELNG